MANMILVGGVAISAPSEMSIGIMDISKADRNGKGEIIIDRIATKRKINLSYSYLSKAALSTLLTAISSVTFSVTYYDPQTGALRTGTFYVGDRNTGIIDFRNGDIRYKDIKFDFVEV